MISFRSPQGMLKQLAADAGQARFAAGNLIVFIGGNHHVSRLIGETLVHGGPVAAFAADPGAPHVIHKDIHGDGIYGHAVLASEGAVRYSGGNFRFMRGVPGIAGSKRCFILSLGNLKAKNRNFRLQAGIGAGCDRNIAVGF